MQARGDSTALPHLDRPFNDGRLALQLSRDATAFPFADFARALVRAHHGEITQRLDGPDESYWDVLLDGQVLTLHRQHYLGVFLCATSPASESVLEGLVPYAKGYLHELRAKQ